MVYNFFTYRFIVIFNLFYELRRGKKIEKRWSAQTGKSGICCLALIMTVCVIVTTKLMSVMTYGLKIDVWNILTVYADRHHCFRSSNMPKTEAGLNFVAVLSSP